MNIYKHNLKKKKFDISIFLTKEWNISRGALTFSHGHMQMNRLCGWTAFSSLSYDFWRVVKWANVRMRHGSTTRLHFTCEIFSVCLGFFFFIMLWLEFVGLFFIKWGHKAWCWVSMRLIPWAFSFYLWSHGEKKQFRIFPQRSSTLSGMLCEKSRIKIRLIVLCFFVTFYGSITDAILL